MCPVEGLLHHRKCPGAGPRSENVTGAGILHQLTFKHSHLGLNTELSECRGGSGKVQKTQNAVSNCLFARGQQISPMTNGLITDLGLNISPKFFFENFIDKCSRSSSYYSHVTYLFADQ